MVVGVGDDNGVVAGHDEAVFAVPEVMEAAIAGHVAVGVVGELLRRFSDEDRAGGGVDDIGRVGAGWVDCGVDFQLFPKVGGCVVRDIAAVEVRAALRRSLAGFAADALIDAPDRALVDCDGGVGCGFATYRSVAGDGALGVLVEGVGGVG